MKGVDRPRSRQIALFLPERISLETTNVSLTPSSVHATARLVERTREGAEAYRAPPQSRGRGSSSRQQQKVSVVDGARSAPMWEQEAHAATLDPTDRGPDIEEMAKADLADALRSAVASLKRELADPTRIHEVQREYREPRMAMMHAQRRQKANPGMPLRYYYAPSTVMREKGVRKYLVAERSEEHDDGKGKKVAPTLLSWLTKNSGAKKGSWSARSVIATEHIQRRRMHVLGLDLHR